MFKKIVSAIILGAIIFYGYPALIRSTYAPLLIGNVDLHYTLRGINVAGEKCEAEGLNGAEFSACVELWAPLIASGLQK